MGLNRNESWAVYRLYDKKGKILYVGTSKRITTRLRAHGQNPLWGKDIARHDIEIFDDPQKALARERSLVKKLRPPHNRKGKNNKGYTPPSYEEYHSVRIHYMAYELLRLSASHEGRTIMETVTRAAEEYAENHKVPLG